MTTSLRFIHVQMQLQERRLPYYLWFVSLSTAGCFCHCLLQFCKLPLALMVLVYQSLLLLSLSAAILQITSCTDCSCHCLLQFCKLPLALIALVTVCCNFANYISQALATLQSCGLPQEAVSSNSQQPSRTERHHPQENQPTPPYTTIDHTNY